MSGDTVRPPSIPYPNVWLTFEVPDENGHLEKYVIQDLPPELFKHAVRYMRVNYLLYDALCHARKLSDHKASIGDFQYMWDDAIRKNRLSLVCFKEGSTKIRGVDVLFVGQRGQQVNWSDYYSQHVKDLDQLAVYMHGQFDVCDHYQVDRYLSGYGMAVLPEYQAHGIVEKFLEARKLLGKACGIPLVSELFNSSDIQKAAEDAGYDKKFEMTFEELAKKNPRFSFDVCKGSTYAMYSVKL